MISDKITLMLNPETKTMALTLEKVNGRRIPLGITTDLTQSEAMELISDIATLFAISLD